MPRAVRLTRGPDIARVRTRGAKLRGDLLELRISRTADEGARIGIIVPRHKRTAVERNKVKRRLREMLRHIRVATPLQGEAIVVAGPRAYGASFETLRDELISLWTRAATQVERR